MASPRRKPPAPAGDERLALALTPAGHLQLRTGDDGDPVDGAAAARLRAAFAAGAGAGLLQLGTAEVSTPLPASIGFWRELATRYVAAVCARGEDATATDLHTPPPDDALA